MSNTPKVNQLLTAALRGAADVTRARLGREVTVVPGTAPDSTAILRFDLPFSVGGQLSWFVSNEDATGFSDMLIGGAGDRGAVLTEMHLDQLTVAFSDMLTRSVDTIIGALDTPTETGELDLRMEEALPQPAPGDVRETLALEISGFGPFPIVQHVDASLAQYLEAHALTGMLTAEPEPALGAAPAAPTAVDIEAIAAAALGEDVPPMSAGPAAFAAQPVVGGMPVAVADNVVHLAPAHTPSFNAPAQPARPTGDLELLMNVPLPLTVELGRTQRTIRELVDFTVGSIIELGKLAGDPLDIMVNDRIIARGEVVVIDEEFGIRVTEIVAPEDRLRGLG